MTAPLLVSFHAVPSAERLALDDLDRRVADVGAFDDVDDVLGDVLGVIADALDRLGDPDDLERSRDRARSPS